MSNDNRTKRIAKQAVTAAKRAVLYARVSTDEQASEGHYSLQTQLEACRQYAQSHGFTVVAEITDDYTGMKLDRPGLEQARNMIDQKQADVIIVLASDRLTRKLAHLLRLREEWRRAGIELHFVNRGKSENTPEHQMTENIEGVFNEYWREKIIESTKRGRDGKAKNNVMILSPIPPFGYTREGKQLVVDEAEARVIQMIFTWYLHGDGDDRPMGVHRIVGRLNELKIPNPKPQMSRGLGVWHNNSVTRILLNELYIGQAYFGKTRVVDGKQTKQSHEKWIPIRVPELAIIDRKTFEAAQRRMRQRNQGVDRTQKYHYLLSGMITCGTCGHSLIGHTFKGVHGKMLTRYECRGALWRADVCKQKRKGVSMEICDTLVWNWILDLFKDPKKVRRKLTDIAKRGEAEIEAKLKQMDIITGLIVKAERKIQRLASTIAETEDTDENETALDALKHQMKLASKEQSELKKDFDRLEGETYRVLITREQVDSFTRRAAALYQRLLDADFNEKRQWLERLGFHAVMAHDENNNRRLDVRCELGEDSLPIDVKAIAPMATFDKPVCRC